MRIGIDLGGTKIEAVALGSSGNELLRRRVATPQGDYDATLAAIEQLVRGVEAQIGTQATVGIGTPGSPSAVTGLMKNCNSTCLNGQPLQQHLSQRLQREVRLANDANCLALSEASDGAAACSHVVFAVILGTGVGGGLVVDKQLWPGANHIAGEWGHNLLPCAPQHFGLADRHCYCGRRNCVETFLSGPGLALSYLELGGEAVDAKVVAERARAGEPLAERVLMMYCRQLAQPLSQLINTIDPDVIVVGGGLSHIDALFTQVPALWASHIFNDQVVTKLVPAHFGDASGVRGAAWLWPAKS